MRAVCVCRLRLGVALLAGDLLRRRLVHGASHVCVAIDAGEHLPVYRVLQLTGVNEQAFSLPIHFMRQRLIAVTVQALLILELVLSGCGNRAQIKSKKQRTKQKTSCGFHAHTLRRASNCRRDSSHTSHSSGLLRARNCKQKCDYNQVTANHACGF